MCSRYLMEQIREFKGSGVVVDEHIEMAGLNAHLPARSPITVAVVIFVNLP